MSDKDATTFEIEGMTCGSCVRHVRDALTEVDGVNAVDVRMRDGVAVVQHDPGAALDRMVQALEAAGYPARPRA